MKQFEEFAFNFSVRESCSPPGLGFLLLFFFFPPLKIQLDVGVSEEVYSCYRGTDYRLLPLSLNFSWLSYAGRFSLHPSLDLWPFTSNVRKEVWLKATVIWTAVPQEQDWADYLILHSCQTRTGSWSLATKRWKMVLGSFFHLLLPTLARIVTRDFHTEPYIFCNTQFAESFWVVLQNWNFEGYCFWFGRHVL